METAPHDTTQPAVVIQKDPWHAPLSKVTVLSKVTAAIVFITLPFVGFWLGMNIERLSPSPMVTIDDKSVAVPTAPSVARPDTVNAEPPLPSSVLSLPTSSFLVKAETGIFRGYLSTYSITEYTQPGSQDEPLTHTCNTFVITEGDVSMFENPPGVEGATVLVERPQPLGLLEIYLGDADSFENQYSEITRKALLSSSATAPVYVAITDYVFNGGKGLAPCESQIEMLSTAN
jgi:hypothetical protein